jgi:hypothetical protein
VLPPAPKQPDAAEQPAAAGAARMTCGPDRAPVHRGCAMRYAAQRSSREGGSRPQHGGRCSRAVRGGEDRSQSCGDEELFTCLSQYAWMSFGGTFGLAA